MDESSVQTRSLISSKRQLKIGSHKGREDKMLCFAASAGASAGHRRVAAYDQRR